jgi:uncharacterized membrane protein
MSTAWDLGIYEQVLWSTVNTGRLFWYTPEILINPSCSFFGIHFSPILFLMLPIYAAFQSTEMLLVLQASVLALAAVPLYKLVLYENHSQKMALTFAIIYLAYPPIYGMIFFDFHVQAFLPVLFFYAFYYFRKEEWWKYTLFTVLSLMVIEFVPLIVAFFGLYGLWLNKRRIFLCLRSLDIRECFHSKTVLFSTLTVVLGIAWFIVANNLIQAINPHSLPHPNWKDFGDPIHNLPAFLLNVITNPIRVLETIVTPVDQKALYVFGLFAPFAFLSFLDTPRLMIGFPWFFVAFLSNYSSYYTPIGYQYIAFVVPFIILSAVSGAKRLLRARANLTNRKHLNFVIAKMARFPRWKAVAGFLLISSITLSYIAVFGINVAIPSPDEHAVLLGTFARYIPLDAVVLTQNDLFPHISRRLYGYVGGGFSEPLLSNLNITYVFIDTTSGWYESSFESIVYNLIKSGDFGVQCAADGIWLFRRGYTEEAVFPIENGVLVGFINQGITMSLFNNTSFSGNPMHKNITSSIIASFGLNIPQTWPYEKPLSLVFEGWLYTPVAGNYTLLLESTGFSALWLDSNLIFHDGDAGHTNMVRQDQSVWLGRGFHKIRLEYAREATVLPYIHLLWMPPWESSVGEIQPAFLYPKMEPDAKTPLLEFRLDFGPRPPHPLIERGHVGVFANCSIDIPTPGIYRFKVAAAGHTSILIDNQLVFSTFENTTSNEFAVLLDRGLHIFQVEYIPSGGNTNLHFLWQPPQTDTFEEIPSTRLSWQGK